MSVYIICKLPRTMPVTQILPTREPKTRFLAGEAPSVRRRTRTKHNPLGHRPLSRINQLPFKALKSLSPLLCQDTVHNMHTDYCHQTQQGEKTIHSHSGGRGKPKALLDQAGKEWLAGSYCYHQHTCSSKQWGKSKYTKRQ